MVAALVDGDRIVIAHVGDSRAYRFRADELEQMTRDHTWVAAMLAADANARTEDHPMRHVLTSGIGMRDDVDPGGDGSTRLPAGTSGCCVRTACTARLTNLL